MSNANDDALLVELFVHRRETYDELDVLRLTRATAAELRAAIAEGEVEPAGEPRRRTFRWADVALLALHRWTPRMVSQALARHGVLEAGLPHLNQTRPIQVELPIYQIRYLHWLARQASEPGKPSLNVSDMLERLLDGDAGAPGDVDAVHLQRAIPGYMKAAEFPRADTPPAVEERCIYCGAVLVGATGACAGCAALHEGLLTPPASPASGSRGA